METAQTNGDYLCVYAVLTCLVLSIVYVASLYVWNSPYPREHSSTIKKRFLSVFIMTLVSPASLYFGMGAHVFEKIFIPSRSTCNIHLLFDNLCDMSGKRHSYLNQEIKGQATIWELLGLRWSGFIQATAASLFLTMILFLGPLSMQGVNGLWRLYTEPMYWLGSAKTLIWWRNQVVAPLSEEWTFRACMLPLLLQCFSPTSAIFICPLFFGVAHFHHVVERTRMGMQFKSALIISCFQFAYTTLFGAYAAFLFARTGHFVAPFAAHSFCNHMGFPDLSEVIDCKDPLKRAVLLCLFVTGLVAWCFLLNPLTNPSWFSNNLFWHKNFL